MYSLTKINLICTHSMKIYLKKSIMGNIMKDIRHKKLSFIKNNLKNNPNCTLGINWLMIMYIWNNSNDIFHIFLLKYFQNNPQGMFLSIIWDFQFRNNVLRNILNIQYLMYILNIDNYIVNIFKFINLKKNHLNIRYNYRVYFHNLGTYFLFFLFFFLNLYIFYLNLTF
jgi:hypothetical protein